VLPRLRYYATEAEPLWTPQLSQLLGAIQTRNFPLVSKAFLEWTEALLPTSPYFDEAVSDEVGSLPRTTVSEIIRSLDPVVHPELDVAHGLRISIGQTQLIDVSDLIDEFGIRRHHREVWRGMQTLLEIFGPPGKNGLLITDMETLLRCAGSIADNFQILETFAESPRLSGFSGRNTRTVHEFLKAIYATEPSYRQFDDTRYVITYRDIVSGTKIVPFPLLKRMDQLRYNLNALLREPWGRNPENLSSDRRRTLRSRSLQPKDKSYNLSFRVQWARWRREDVMLDEEFLCTSMLGFSRSFSLSEILIKIFSYRYGINIAYSDNAEEIVIEGGYVFPPDHSLRPTKRLLHATVDSLGSMGHMSLCLRLLDHLSRLYGLPLTHELWSKLLRWTYINASKPVATVRNYVSQSRGKSQEHLRSGPEHVHEIISMMTSEPFNIELSFEDNIILAKTLIVGREYDDARIVIRGKLIPYYEALAREHQQAIVDEVLRNDAVPFSALVDRHSRQKAQIKLDHAWHGIQLVLDRLIKTLGNHRPSVEHPDNVDLVPDLIDEFGSFFTGTVIYRTEQGIVKLNRGSEVAGASRISVHMADRLMLPARLSAYQARTVIKFTEPDGPSDDADPLGQESGIPFFDTSLDEPQLSHVSDEQQPSDLSHDFSFMSQESGYPQDDTNLGEQQPRSMSDDVELDEQQTDHLSGDAHSDSQQSSNTTDNTGLSEQQPSYLSGGTVLSEQDLEWHAAEHSAVEDLEDVEVPYAPRRAGRTKPMRLLEPLVPDSPESNRELPQKMVRQLARVPAKRDSDLMMPPVEAHASEKAAWREKLVKELSM
jgi:hypothetical protein